MHIIAHGGAGGPIDEPDERQAVLDNAVSAGRNENTPVDAVIEAVRRLESSPRFNAGVGGAVQSDGVVRTDAGLMTDDRQVGAACSMPGVEHACEVARIVMRETPHVLIAGEQAVELADAFGIETDCDLWSTYTRERWADLTPPQPDGPRAQLEWLRDEFGGTDTVGAVATDGDTVAACTSTGGRWCALAGRVGDVPQVGSGFYCTHAGGASATGAGEDIARVTLSRRAVDHLELGRDPQDAAELAIEECEELTGGTAGVIVLNHEGSVGSAFNSAEMQTSVTRE
jgi:beta-aspartyl-peptidase (threonine type)